MKTPRKAKPVDRASPTVRKPKGRDDEKIGVTRATTTAMAASPEWNDAPEVRSAAKSWIKVADSIEANAKIISDLRGRLGTAEASQRGHRRDWNAAMKQTNASVALFCQGSADRVHAFGFDVRTRVAAGPVAAPQHLAVSPGTASGDATLTWDRGGARHGFVLQYASDVGDAGTVSATIPCVHPRFLLEGREPRAVVYFRVAAIDAVERAGQGPWSAWVGGAVR